MGNTKIEWAEKTWNPVTGCTKASEGCANCYAERMSKRLAGRVGYPADEPFKVTLHPDRLKEPLRWKKPARIFVCSMSDLFHEDIPFEFIAKVFDVIHNARNHTYLLLTKRPQRMKEFIEWCFRYWEWETWVDWEGEFRHLWLGVTAENQQTADERIPILLQIPAAVRWVSVEPMLGPVNLTSIDHGWQINALTGEQSDMCRPYYDTGKLNWVACGGESGHGARPMHPDWARDLRDQCQATNVPYFFKQWGEYAPNWLNDESGKIPGSEWIDRMGKKMAGRVLDGCTWDDMPVVV